MDAGLLAAGTTLRFERPRVGTVHQATVTDVGRIQLADGQEFRSPSRAAMVAAGMRAVDGWHAWTIASNRRPLDLLRQELLDQAVNRAQPAEQLDDESVLPQRIHERLRDARRKAEENRPEKISVRELLSLWGAKGRGDQISRIEADLANHGLVTSPSFRKVTLDATVQLITASQRAESSNVLPVTDDPEENEQLDIGLTVGNLPSALGGVEFVSPTATLDEAITKMLLNDFSQLAVLGGAHNLRGAVTWKSITQARHSRPDAYLSDAIVHAHDVHYDRELIDVLPTLQISDFIFVRNEKNAIAGIVTTADVVDAYRELATPFFLIGELDQTLRRVLARSFDIDDVIAVCDPHGNRSLRSFNDLSMGDYQRVLERPDSWQRIGWPLDRSSFIKRLHEIRKIRNDVMHFNPDPPPRESVNMMRNIIKLLRDYGE